MLEARGYRVVLGKHITGKPCPGNDYLTGNRCAASRRPERDADPCPTFRPLSSVREAATVRCVCSTVSNWDRFADAGTETRSSGTATLRACIHSPAIDVCGWNGDSCSRWSERCSKLEWRGRTHCLSGSLLEGIGSVWNASGRTGAHLQTVFALWIGRGRTDGWLSLSAGPMPVASRYAPDYRGKIVASGRCRGGRLS